MTAFLSDKDYFELLLQRMTPHDRAGYDKLKHNRAESVSAGRSFRVYKVRSHQCVSAEDTVKVLTFDASEAEGARCELRSMRTGQVLEVRYQPVRLWEYPVFVWLPLHIRLNWDATVRDPDSPSLAWGLVIRTASRRHLREEGVTYMETNTEFAREFGNP